MEGLHLRDSQDAIYLCLDEYFLHLEVRNILDNFKQSRTNDLIAAHLASREGAKNDFLTMSIWLRLASDPEKFYQDDQGESLPGLKRALDMSDVVRGIVEGHSKRKACPRLTVAFESVERCLRIAMLSLCCSRFRSDLALELYESMPGESSAQIPSNLLESMASGTDHDCSGDVDNLQRAVMEFTEEFGRLLPKSALALMVESTSQRGSADSDSKDIEALIDPGTPMLNLTTLPKPVQEVQERRIDLWSKQLENGKSSADILRTLNIRERLKTLNKDRQAGDRCQNALKMLNIRECLMSLCRSGTATDNARSEDDGLLSEGDSNDDDESVGDFLNSYVGEIDEPLDDLDLDDVLPTGPLNFLDHTVTGLDRSCEKQRQSPKRPGAHSTSSCSYRRPPQSQMTQKGSHIEELSGESSADSYNVTSTQTRKEKRTRTKGTRMTKEDKRKIFRRDRVVRTKKRKRWSKEEEDRLIKTVQELGRSGQKGYYWADIQDTGRFPGRSNIDLKDKWRNLLKKKPDLEKSCST